MTVERLTAGLNLTAEQQTKVGTILKTARQESQSIRGKSGSEEGRPKTQNLIRQKIMEVLTEDQKRKLEELAQSPQTEPRRPTRIWILSSDGKPVSLSIFLGITNGSFSELVSGDLKEGNEVSVGETATGKGQNQGAPSPFGRSGIRK